MAIIPGVRALECVEERLRTIGIKTETPGGRILTYHIKALGVRVLQKPRMLGLFFFFFFFHGLVLFVHRNRMAYHGRGTSEIGNESQGPLPCSHSS